MDNLDGWVVREFGPKESERTALFLPGALASHVFIEDVAAAPEIRPCAWSRRRARLRRYASACR